MTTATLETPSADLPAKIAASVSPPLWRRLGLLCAALATSAQRVENAKKNFHRVGNSFRGSVVRHAQLDLAQAEAEHLALLGQFTTIQTLVSTCLEGATHDKHH